MCLASLGATAWLLVTEEGAWRSEDDGDSWTELPPEAPTACAQGAEGAWVAGEDGVWFVGDEVSRIHAGPAVAVAEAEGVVYALDRDGALFDPVTGVALHAGPWAAIGGGETLLLADGPGVAWWDGDAPVPTVEGPRDAVVLSGGDAWLAAAADGGVWVSEDGGVSWTEESAGLEPHEGGSGSPTDGRYWTAILGDAPWLAASWEGLYVWEGRWAQRELRTLPLVRSLQWLDDGTLLTAPYGGGLARGTPAAGDWVDAGPSLGWPWARQVLATEGGVGDWYVVGGVHLYRSGDQGRSWDVVHTGLSLVGDVVAVAPGWPADPRMWVGGEHEGGGGALASSEDGGVTWVITPLDGCREKPSALAAGASVWVACGGGLWRDGVAEPLPEAWGRAAVHTLLVEDGGVAVAGAGGLWRLQEGWEPLLLEPVRAAAHDGVGWIVATDEGLVTLDERGETRWGWPVDDLVVSLAAGDGRLAVGTFGGAWVWDDGWALATDWDRYDDEDATWYHEGWAEVEDVSAKAGRARAGEPGAVAEWSLEATALLVRLGGSGRIAVAIDGEREELPVGGDGWRVGWSRSLDEGRHTLRIEVLQGRVLLDGGERWRLPGAVPPPREVPPEPEPAGCGCAGGAGLLPLAALGVVPRRRRRG
jgi:uncharacterized protein (TIGR03382 family)